MRALTQLLVVTCLILAGLGCSGSYSPVTYTEADTDANTSLTVNTAGAVMQVSPALFTDFTDAQFMGLYLDNLNWVASIASGTGGNLFKIENLALSSTYPGDNGTGYLSMTVRANVKEGAEITTFREKEYHYGTYMTRLKPSPVAGCINAFFTKNFTGFNDEIDIEFLTNTFGGGKGQVEFTLHPHVGASGSQYHRVINLDFDPSQAFHEYGFEWTYAQIEYFIDGKSITTFKRSEGAPIQTHPGTMMYNVWVSANPAWGGGPPTQDATMVVDWCKFWPEGTSINDEPEIVQFQAKQ